MFLFGSLSSSLVENEGGYGMGFFQWNDKMSVSHPEMDNQHKKLIDMINTFYDNIKSEKQKENLATLLDEMIKYTDYHFKAEEKIWNVPQYGQSEAHKAQHSQFVNKIKDVYQRFASGQTVMSMEVTGFLKKWLTDHIMGMDQTYSVLFQKDKVT